MPHKLRSWQLEVDALLSVLIEDQEVLLHLEFQTYRDATMSQRLLQYNVLIRIEYGLPVISYVIYLLKGGARPATPLCWEAPAGQEVLRFHFGSIEIGDLTPEEIVSTHQARLLPLLPLTRGGASRNVVRMMVNKLEPDNVSQEELAVIGFTFASMVFQREHNSVDQEWLIRSFKEMYDLIRDTPIYHEMTRMAREEGLKEGLEEGLKEGLKEGEQKALRGAILDIVQERFPKLVELASSQVKLVNDTIVLRRLVVKPSLTRSMKEVR
jgi:predicted transposase YdaD